jgi:hypothetical protein
VSDLEHDHHEASPAVLVVPEELAWGDVANLHHVAVIAAREAGRQRPSKETLLNQAEALRLCPACWLEVHSVMKRGGNVRNDVDGLIES